MSVLGYLRTAFIGLCCTTLLLFAGPASAEEVRGCIDQGSTTEFEGPTCFEVEGPDPFSFGPVESATGLFGAFFILAVLVGIGVAVWKVSTARKLAQEAGMDPDVATGMTLLDENGLSATYLASSLRTAPGPVAAATTSSAADRLGELSRLLEGGLITQAEYDERRKAIIDSV